MDQPSYASRIQAQIAQYAETVDMHELPAIFHVWSHNYIGPGLKHVFGTSSIDEAYALAYIEARHGKTDSGRILSIGSGDGGVELRVAKTLLGRGISDFTFVCAELSPILLNHFRAAVAREGMDAYFDAVQADLNQIAVPGTFDVIMANHALHHIEGLEALFAYCHERLRDGGILATCDMIGRNGHLRWPEAAAVVQAVWQVLRPEQRYHAQLKRYSDPFRDHDCSKEGFEGIRAQDILSLLLRTFHPYKFFGTGGIVDLLVDRGYGHGYNADDDNDVSFIRFMADLNEILLDSGVVKPTWTMAYFTKDDRGEIFYRDRRAVAAVRDRDGDPAWTRFYPATDFS